MPQERSRLLFYVGLTLSGLLGLTALIVSIYYTLPLINGSFNWLLGFLGTRFVTHFPIDEPFRLIALGALSCFTLASVSFIKNSKNELEESGDLWALIFFMLFSGISICLFA